MARRTFSGGWQIANDLKGRTLREIINLGISIAFQCDQCGRTAVWPWPWMTRERRLQPLMSKMIHEFAHKLCCVNCGAKNFYVRTYVPADSIKPTH